MEKGAFGDSKEFLVIEYITKKMESLSVKDRNRMSVFIHQFYKNCKYFDSIDANIADYMYQLIKASYTKRIDDLGVTYDKALLDRLKNLVYGKLNNIFTLKRELAKKNKALVKHAQDLTKLPKKYK